MSDATGALRERAGGAHGPYRALLRDVRRGLDLTRRGVEEQLAVLPGSRSGVRAEEVFATAEQLTAPLRLCF